MRGTRKQRGAVTVEQGVLLVAVGLAGMGGLAALGHGAERAIAGDAQGGRTVAEVAGAATVAPGAQAGIAGGFERLAKAAGHTGAARTSVGDLRRAIGDANMLDSLDGVWDALRRGDTEIDGEVARAWLGDESASRLDRTHAAQASGPNEWGISFPEHRLRDHLSLKELGHWGDAFDDAVLDLGRAASAEGDATLLARLRRFLRGDSSPASVVAGADRLVDVSEIVPLQTFRAEVLDQAKRLIPYGDASLGSSGYGAWLSYDPAALPKSGLDRLRALSDVVAQNPELAAGLGRGGYTVGFVDLGKWQPDLAKVPFVSVGPGKLLINASDELNLSPERVLAVLEDERAARVIEEARRDLPQFARVDFPELEGLGDYKALLRERLPVTEVGTEARVRVWRAPNDERARDVAAQEVVPQAELRTLRDSSVPPEARYDGALQNALASGGFAHEAELLRTGRAGLQIEAAHFRSLARTEQARRAPLKLPGYVADGETGRFFLNLDAGGPFPTEAVARFIRQQTGHRLQ